MKRISILSLLTMCFVATFAQMRTITGIVMDETSKNEGLVGAMIAIKDGKSTKGTVTDSEGKFLLSLSADIKVMTVSSMGYETKKVTLEPGVSHYTITLHPVNQHLDEFVVTGYQQIDRRKLTAAVRSDFCGFVCRLRRCCQEYRPGTCRSGGRSFIGNVEWCPRFTGKDSHSRYRFDKRRAGASVGARRYSFGG